MIFSKKLGAAIAKLMGRDPGAEIREDLRQFKQIVESGEVPRLDLNLEKMVQDTLLKLAGEMLLNSAHDCSDGGLAVAIAESCFSSLGRDARSAHVDMTNSDISTEALLFGESPSRIVVSFAPANLERIKSILGDCPFEVIGNVSGNDLLPGPMRAEGTSANTREMPSSNDRILAYHPDIGDPLTRKLAGDHQLPHAFDRHTQQVGCFSQRDLDCHSE